MQIKKKIPEVPPHTVRMAKIKNSGDSRCWQGCGERGTLLSAGMIANLFNHSENQLCIFSENWKYFHLKTQHSWAYIP